MLIYGYPFVQLCSLLARYVAPIVLRIFLVRFRYGKSKPRPIFLCLQYCIRELDDMLRNEPLCKSTKVSCAIVCCL